jgi:hypothetical protein
MDIDKTLYLRLERLKCHQNTTPSHHARMYKRLLPSREASPSSGLGIVQTAITKKNTTHLRVGVVKIKERGKHKSEDHIESAHQCCVVTIVPQLTILCQS